MHTSVTGLLDFDDSTQIDCVGPVNVLHPLNYGLTDWLLCVPGLMGGKRWMNLARTGDGNHGTLTSMDPVTDWTHAYDRPGGRGYLDFDATDDHVILDREIDSTGTCFLSCWFRAANTASTRVLFYAVKTGSENVDFLAVGTFSGTILASGDNTNAASKQSSAVGNNTNYHLLVTKTTGQLVDIYVNGVAVTAAGSAFWAGGAGKAVVGASWNTGVAALSWGGSVDSIRFQRGWLPTAEQVRMIYEEERRGYPAFLNRLPQFWAEEEDAAGGAPPQVVGVRDGEKFRTALAGERARTLLLGRR